MKKILICGATGFIGKNITLGFSKIKIMKYMRSGLIDHHMKLQKM